MKIWPGSRLPGDASAPPMRGQFSLRARGGGNSFGGTLYRATRDRTALCHEILSHRILSGGTPHHRNLPRETHSGWIPGDETPDGSLLPRTNIHQRRGLPNVPRSACTVDVNGRTPAGRIPIVHFHSLPG